MLLFDGKAKRSKRLFKLVIFTVRIGEYPRLFKRKRSLFVEKLLVNTHRNYIRKASGRDKFDLVFIDPPYAMECCVDAAMRLADAELIIPGAIVVMESGTEEINENDPRLTGFEFVKSTNYGKKTAVNILIYRGEEA